MTPSRSARGLATVASPGLAVAVTLAGCITARAPYMDGLTYEREYKPAEAIAAYRDALSMDASFVPAHRRLALLLKVADPAAALTHASKVLEADPGDQEMRELRDALLKATPQQPQGAPPPSEAPPPQPKRTQFVNARAHVDELLQDGKDQEALRFLEETVADDPQACWAFERMHAIRVRLHDREGADRAKKALSACRSAR